MNKNTLADILFTYPEEKGAETALIFLDTHGQENRTFTYNSLKETCIQTAVNLQQVMQPGQKLLLAIEDQANFVPGFFGCILAGVVPAPLPPFKHAKDKQGYGRMLQILKSGRFSGILVEEAQRVWLQEALAQESLGPLNILSIESLRDQVPAETGTLPVIRPGDIAYLQYTSGSTAQPRGIILRHEQVMHNVAKIHRVFQRPERARLVAWLPFHHDMGLVGQLFSLLYEAGLGVFIPTSAFISSPQLWLKTISHYKANASAAPTFAYEHCTRKVAADPSLDLSSWKYALVGSETVSLPVLEQFSDKFRAVGFRRNTFKPVYGLAETTLLVAGGALGLDELDPHIHWKQAGKNTKRALIPYQTDPESEIIISGLTTHKPCAEGQEGEIWVKSASNASGYYDDTANKEHPFNGTVNTGDTGFVQNGFLYLTGRVKEIIIVRGVNYDTEELETCARYQVKDLQTNDQTVGVSELEETGERFFIFQEVHRHKQKAELEKIAGQIRANLLENYGITPDEIVLVAQGLIPRTTNHKISRKACLAQYLAGNLTTMYPGNQKNTPVSPADHTDPVVVIGMACRFPGGADSPEKYWELLSTGADAVIEVPPDRWDNALFYDKRPAVPGKVNTKWAGFVDHIDHFDPALFGISAYEAPELDPQQRLLLETSWRLIENAGLKKAAIAGSDTGVFIGMSTNDYLYMKIKLSPGMEGFNAYSGLGNSNSVAANRLSYFYDFKGPSVAVDTACSSSLTALHLAAQAILSGSCTQAIAGGVNAILSPGPTITLSQFGMLSPEGKCKTFDAGANGYVRAEGCGLVMLKRRSAAEKDGDPILGIIRSTVMGQDGLSPGITFPNGKAQHQLIERGLRVAGLSGKDIGYVEAHGTGTSSGDPVEMEQVKKLYGQGSNETCYVGSVKANIGHLEAGAGVASVIKSLLMLREKKIPPQIHLHTLNPLIQLDDTRLKITRELLDWDSAHSARRVAISSFGFGGSLAHAIVEEPATHETARHQPSNYRYAQRNFVFSALSAKGLLEQAKLLYDWLDQGTRLSIEDICYTQANCRSDLKYRKYFLVDSKKQLKEKLHDFITLEGIAHAEPVQSAAIAYLFTGQGEHYLHMGRTLYRRSPVFRQAFDRCALVVDREIGDAFSLSHIAFEETDTTFWLDKYMQPILFAVQYALGTLWQECGAMPDYLVGHSLGEYAAACLAGCFEPETGMAVLLKRAALVDTIQDTGLMVTIFAGHEEVRKIMDPEKVQIAAINSDKKTVISGNNLAVADTMRHFEALGVGTYHLKTSHAFHSHLMQPITAEFGEFLKGFHFKKPGKKWFSALKGKEMQDAPDADYWVAHLLGTVNFKAALQQLPLTVPIHFMEIGPGASTLAAVNETLPVKGALMLRSLNIKKGERTEDYFFYDSMGKLYQAGVNINWNPIFEGRAFPASVPGQKFMHQSYWADGINAEGFSQFMHPSAAPGVTVTKKTAETSHAKIYDLPWKEAEAIPLIAQGTEELKDTNWIVVGEAGPVVQSMLGQLKEHRANSFWIGLPSPSSLKKIKPDFAVSHSDGTDTWADVIDKIVHLKSRDNSSKWKLVFVSPGTGSVLEIPLLEQAVGNNTGPLIAMLQSLKKNALILPVWIVTHRSQQVAVGAEKQETPNLSHAPVWGFAKTCFLEHPELRGGLIDLDDDTDTSVVLAKVVKPGVERSIALRNGRQYIQYLVERTGDDLFPPHPFDELRVTAGAPAAIDDLVSSTDNATGGALVRLSPSKPRDGLPKLVLRTDGAYIITGGLGGLGLQTASWLINHGVTRLVLLSRKQLPPRDTWDTLADHDPLYEITRQLSGFYQRGADITIVALDIRDTAGLEKVFEAIDQQGIPVRGVIHAAGVNWFSKVMNLDKTDFLETLKIKVSASLALHQLTVNRDLDCFLLFSSVSALWGSVELSHYTAANHFMDRLSVYRSQAGYPSLCVNWGPWAESGMSAGDHEAVILKKLGFNLMPSAVALNRMEQALIARTPLALITDIEWERFNSFIDFSLQPSLFAGVRAAEAKGSHQAHDHLSSLLKSTPEKAREMVEDAVRMKLRSVMLIDSTDKLDHEQRFNFLGMDSLMAISFAFELEQYFGCSLPNTLAYNYPTIKAVSDYIFSTIYLGDGLPEAETAAGIPATDQAAESKQDPVVLFKPITHHPGKPRLTLFCFPYLGAGASVYEKWSTLFSEDIALVAVQTPGREERSDVAPFVSMPDLVGELLANFTCPEGDFIFFGHSFGALTAYEFYNALQRNTGKSPVKLFLSGCEAPLEPSQSKVHELPEPEFIEEILAKYDNSKNVDERKRALSNNSSLLRADLQVLESYLPMQEPVHVPLVVIAGLHDPISRVEKVKDWIKLAGNDFAIRYIDGGHEMVKENSHDLARIIQEETANHSTDYRERT